jgi:hypothetical protein
MKNYRIDISACGTVGYGGGGVSLYVPKGTLLSEEAITSGSCFSVVSLCSPILDPHYLNTLLQFRLPHAKSNRVSCEVIQVVLTGAFMQHSTFPTANRKAQSHLALRKLKKAISLLFQVSTPIL